MHPLINVERSYNLYFGRTLIKSFASMPSEEELAFEVSRINIEKLENEILDFLVIPEKTGKCDGCSRKDANDLLEGHLCFHCPDKDVWTYKCIYCHSAYQTYNEAKECAFKCFREKFPFLPEKES